MNNIPLTAGWLAGAILTLTSATADANVIFAENFDDGLGQFSADGRVFTGSDNVTLRGGTLFTGPAQISSGPIDIGGSNQLTLSYDRRLNWLDDGESFTAAYSTDGLNYTSLNSEQTGEGSVSLDIGNVGGPGELYLRFSIDASSFFESAQLNAVRLESGPGGDDDALPEEGDFVTFESGHVRPMALSSDGSTLYVVNTPDSSVQVFDVSGSTPALTEVIPTGLEPVSVALNGNNELWVVNHLSDSVSVVDVSSSPARITNTLYVGDEPRDIVFAGEQNQWAFITAAHRGQNAPFDPQLTTEGVGRADVWVFNADNPGSSLGGEPATILNMFGDTLRGLARNADGSRVYTAVLNSGNQSTVLTDDIGAGGIDKAPPFQASDGTAQPATGLIVQYDGENWMGPGDPMTGTPPKVWNDRVNLNLPDYDVFTIDTSGSVPTVIERTSGVGTTLFNLAVNPSNNKVYVSNQEALNLTRFEGVDENYTSVRGDFVRNRITVVDNNQAYPRHLNKHIDYSRSLGTADERERSLATPMEMAVSGDGEHLYVAAMGSGKLARLSTSALEDDSFEPSVEDHLILSAGGPTGVVLDETRNRAFVTTRFDNGLSVVSLGDSLAELSHITMHNPEPAHVIAGRPLLYDANYTSSRGNSSCAGCHILGDMDHLSWDLGDPGKSPFVHPNEYNENIPSLGRNQTLHSMKGPMTTQSLRGLKGNGPMHWRGDRTGQDRGPGETLEEAAFKEFNEAFVGLLGREHELTEAEMDAFTEFALDLTYPPNPIANLDNSLTPRQQEAMEVYNTVTSDFIATCNGCHVLDPERGMFGTDGTMAIEGPGVEEDMKIPHLRNMYQKIGMFAKNTQEQDAEHLGDQIRGFGYDNSGASGSIDEFLSAPVFILLGERRRLLVQDLALAFPSEMNPIVGQQVTVNTNNHNQSDIQARLDLLIQRALVTRPRAECDLVATSVENGQSRRWVLNSNSRFVPGQGDGPGLGRNDLLSATVGQNYPVTFTCVPPGSGVRMAMSGS